MNASEVPHEMWLAGKHTRREICEKVVWWPVRAVMMGNSAVADSDTGMLASDTGDACFRHGDGLEVFENGMLA